MKEIWAHVEHSVITKPTKIMIDWFVFVFFSSDTSKTHFTLQIKGEERKKIYRRILNDYSKNECVYFYVRE